MSVILLEGPDGGGKSTLAATLSNTVYHNGPPPAGASKEETFWWQLAGLRPELGATPRVIDRNWPSEQIYHRFAGRPNVFNPIIGRMFERYLLSVGGVMVMCLPPYIVAYANWYKRMMEGKELITRDAEFATMYEFYRTYRSSVPQLHYDYTSAIAPLLAAHVEIFSPRKNPFGSLQVGNPEAKILVVGEQCNVAGLGDHPKLPFIKPNGSSYWLTHELMKAGYSEYELRFMNALKPDGTVMDYPVGRDQPKVILAVGKVAQSWAYGGAAAVIDLPHPAYWSRFHAGEEYPLHHFRSLINEALYS
jgi:hypothetical protein